VPTASASQARQRSTVPRLRKSAFICGWFVLTFAPWRLCVSLRLLLPMASADIYVQITATVPSSGRSKSVVVLVPRNAIEECKSGLRSTNDEDQSVARRLADPLASYVFTHRPSFGRFRLAYSFTKTPPPEIQHEAPELTRGDLKAWLV
jgi:hypothetical protein